MGSPEAPEKAHSGRQPRRSPPASDLRAAGRGRPANLKGPKPDLSRTCQLPSVHRTGRDAGRPERHGDIGDGDTATRRPSRAIAIPRIPLSNSQQIDKTIVIGLRHRLTSDNATRQAPHPVAAQESIRYVHRDRDALAARRVPQHQTTMRLISNLRQPLRNFAVLDASNLSRTNAPEWHTIVTDAYALSTELTHSSNPPTSTI